MATSPTGSATCRCRGRWAWRSAGKMVGFSATGGIALKRRLLALEGAIQEQPDLFG